MVFDHIVAFLMKSFRDLKPENILVDANGYIKLCDFGGSFKLSSPNEQAKTMTGTPDYMAPEMIQNQAHNRAVDYWAMGCLMYDMICRESSYTKSLLAAVRSFVSVHQLTADVFAEEPFSDTGTTNDDDILAAIMKYTKTKKLKWKNGNKKVRVDRITKALVEQLLNPDPTKRLGMGTDGADAVRNHEYFAHFDWKSLRQKSMTIPVDWRPDPKLCGTDLIDEHHDESPLTALQRMKHEYAVLREQYMTMLTVQGAAISSSVSRKRPSNSQPATDLRRPSISRRVSSVNSTGTGAPEAGSSTFSRMQNINKVDDDRPMTPPRSGTSPSLPAELFDF